MFTKLIKYEFHATRRLIPFIWLGTFVMAALNLITGHIGVEWLFGTSMVFLILLAVAQILITYIVVVTRYYRSFYSNEGYLMHTIPANASALLGSKVLTSFVWLLLSYIVTAITVLAIIFSVTNRQAISISTVISDFMTVTGFSRATIIKIIAGFCLYIIFVIFYQMAQLYFAMSLGSLSVFHKLGIAAPIIFYLVINFILEMITLIAMVFIPLGIRINIDPNEIPTGIDLVPKGMLHIILNPDSSEFVFGLGGIILPVITMICLYIGCHKLLKKHVSLK